MKPCRLTELEPDRLAEYRAVLSLRHCPGLGSRRQAKLIALYGSAVRACAASAEWQSHGIGAAAAFASASYREAAESEFQSAVKSDAAILLRSDPDYPPLLAEIPDAPLVLYLRGDATLLARPCIGIVGTRNPTAKSMSIARQLGRALGACGLTVVSGLALGIDREAHLGSITEAGRSIGVLGTGIDIIYPRTNRDVYRDLAESGLLLSEFPPETAPVGRNFPIRNRIISGLSLGVVVVEAAAKSGSLITARMAAEQNRTVYAVPGDAFSSHSLGCQQLIRQGATPVFGPQDILADLAPQLAAWDVPAHGPAATSAWAPPPSAPKKTAPLPEGAPGQVLACLLNKGPLHADFIADATGLADGELASALLSLEMQGLIRMLPGSRYEALEQGC